MPFSTRRPPHLEVILGSRLFAVLVLGAPVLWNRDLDALFGLAAVGGVWVVCSVLLRTTLPLLGLVVVEALVVGALTGWHAASLPGLAAAVAFPPLAAGLWFRTSGVVISSLLTTAALFTTLAAAQVQPDVAALTTVSTWLVSGLGVGLLTSAFAGLTARDPGAGSHYREARELIQDLTRLSSHLSTGLDAQVLAGLLLDRVGAVVPARFLQVSAVSHGVLVPLATRSLESSQTAPVALMQQAERLGVARFRGPDFAVPVITRGVSVAVVGGRLPSDDPAARSALRRQVAALEPVALRLDTALLFAELREAATAGERNRLAREIHDGVAQEIASMGYYVDALLLDATPSMQEDLMRLRATITTVVSEVRSSVTTLRTQVGSQESLGAGVATLARHLSDSSGIPITVIVDETTERLRHEVEAELLRIAQEAMNNAVKHARPSHIEVECRVAAPRAVLTVHDDGIGLGDSRPDSHGLTIMAERAGLIGAELSVRGNTNGGTTVRVELARDAASGTTPVSGPMDSPRTDRSPEVSPGRTSGALPEGQPVSLLRRSPTATVRAWSLPVRTALERLRRTPDPVGSLLDPGPELPVTTASSVLPAHDQAAGDRSFLVPRPRGR